MANSDYLDKMPKEGDFLIKWFVENISDVVDFSKVRTILDIGSRDLMQSFEFKTFFPECKVHAFEANRRAIETCRNNLRPRVPPVNDHGHPFRGVPDRDKEDITLYPWAVSDKSGLIDFHEVDLERSPSPSIGASSIFKVRDDFTREEWVQNKVTVPTGTIDGWRETENIPKIDLVWMDIQGAELLAFKGMAKTLAHVKAIHTEAGVKAYYHGHTLLPEIDEFLAAHDFVRAKTEMAHEWEANVIYVKRSLYYYTGTY